MSLADAVLIFAVTFVAASGVLTLLRWWDDR